MGSFSDKLRGYEELGVLCGAFRLHAPFDKFKAWLYDYTRSVRQPFCAEVSGERYCIIPLPAKEYGDFMKEAILTLPVGKEALREPEIIAEISPERPIQQFIIRGKGQPAPRPSPTVIYIKCVRLDEQRMNVFVYSTDPAFHAYAKQLVGIMKANWKWEDIETAEATLPAGESLLPTSEKEREQRFRELHAQGLPDTEIARELHIHQSTAQRFRHYRLGLPPNSPPGYSPKRKKPQR